MCFVCFFKQKTAYELRISDWSSDVCSSDLDWVILRPCTLVDAPGTGRVRTGLAIPYGDVPRDDLAATLLEIIERPAVSRLIIELTAGDTPVAQSEIGRAHV